MQARKRLSFRIRVLLGILGVLTLGFVLARYHHENQGTTAQNTAQTTDADVILTIDNRGNSDYLVLKVEGADGVAELNTPDPTWTLTIGTRYRIINKGRRNIHPFELIDQAASGRPSDDGILLSQKARVQGRFEADPAVAWVEDDEGVTFTLTPELAQVLKGYRCGVHTRSMRGDIEVIEGAGG